MAVLGLHCCTGFSLVAESGGCSLLRCMGSRVWEVSSGSSQALEYRLSGCGRQGLVALWLVKSSQNRDGTHVPYIGRWIFNHWTAREVQEFPFKHCFSFISQIDFCYFHLGFPGGASGKESACQFRRPKRRGFNLWTGKNSWSRKWYPIPLFLPGK